MPSSLECEHIVVKGHLYDPVSETAALGPMQRVRESRTTYAT